MRENDKHYTSEEWADFARGRCSDDVWHEMQEHLQGGCPGCSSLLELWLGVLEIAEREEVFEPPPAAMRCAKALYSMFPPQQEKGPMFVFAHMVRMGQAALEGVRSAGPSTGHILFKEGTLLLDVHMQPRSAAERVSMVGQLLDTGHAQKIFANRAVSVMREKDILARTKTNGFGEFRLEFEPAADLLVMIELENNSYLVSRLPQTTQG